MVKSKFFERAERALGAFILSAPMIAPSAFGAAQAQTAIQAAQTAASAPRPYDIPAGEISTALTRWAQASGVRLLASSEALHGVKTQGAAGPYTPEGALQQLLKGTSLTYRFTGKRTVAVLDRSAVEANAQSVELQTINVEGQTDNSPMKLPAPYAGGQVAQGSQLGVLGNTNFMNTPFNQTSYTAKKAQDQQARTIKDVLIDDPSVQDLQSPFGVSGDNLKIRGFDVGSGSIAYGGLYGILPRWSVVSELAERVEVLKGPSALLNGMPPSGEIGGTVNIVPKRAPNETLVQFTPSYASTGNVGGHVDVGHRFGQDKQFGARFNGVYRDGETAVANNSDQRALGLLGLDFRGDRVRLSADIGYQRRNLEGVVPSVAWASTGALPAAPDAHSNYGQPWAFHKFDDKFGVVRGEVDITKDVTAYATYGAYELNRSFFGVVSILNTTADGNGSSFPGRIENYVKIRSGEAGLRARLDTGPIEHQLAFAAAMFDWESGFGFNAGSTFATNIYSPVTVAAPTIATPTAAKEATISQPGLAFADTLSILNKRIQLTVGARLQKAETVNFDRTTGAETSKYDDSALSPAVALVIKPLENLSLYGNFIQGLQQGEIVGSSYANAGEAFPPYKSEQYEAGVKVDWGTFVTTASVFQITKPSVVTDLATNTRVLDGEQRNRGLELNVFGEPVKGIRVLGGAMLLDPVLTKTQGGLADGQDAPNTPDLQLRLAGEWDAPFVRGLTFSGRAIYTSEQYIGTGSGRRSLPDWTRFDVGARYTVEGVKSPTGKPIVVRFSVENVFDKDYWLTEGWLGAPRTFLLSTSFNF